MAGVEEEGGRRLCSNVGRRLPLPCESSKAALSPSPLLFGGIRIVNIYKTIPQWKRGVPEWVDSDWLQREEGSVMPLPLPAHLPLTLDSSCIMNE